MNPTPEEVLQKAKDRGFSVHMQSGDKSWYALMSDKSPIALHLYPKTNEFEIHYVHGVFTLSSGKCGSFMSDDHFSKIANQGHALAKKLQQ
jgi:hypothetical protein